MRSRKSNRSVLALALIPAAIATLAHAEEPALPDSRMGVPTAPLLLLSRVDVRADLGLSAEQAEAAAREIRALHARAAELKGKKTSDAVQARRAIDDAQQRWLSEALSPAQRERLGEIELQWEGPSALLRRKAIAEDLGLTTEQLKTLGEAVAARDLERLKGKASPADEAPLAQRTLSILTPDQKKRWLELLGKPCAFQVQFAKAPREAPARR